MAGDNGDSHSGRVTIDTVDNVKLGYALFCAGKQPPKPEALPEFLNRTLQSWLESNPQKVVRTALGIVRGGETQAIYVWYDDVGSDHASQE